MESFPSPLATDLSVRFHYRLQHGPCFGSANQRSGRHRNRQSRVQRRVKPRAENEAAECEEGSFLWQMASGQLSRAEALACSGCTHACHVMLYSDTKTQLFGKFPIRHIILMQMRFDGLLGFPGGLVNPSEETLEAGLGRELWEELGVALPVSVEDHVGSCHAPASLPSSSSSSCLITHFYVKKMEEEQIREVERAAASTATDHGHEVLGMVRVPLYTMRGGKGLGSFLSHSFISNARGQLVDSLLRLNLVAPEELHKALECSLTTHAHSAGDLKSALALTASERKRF